MFSRFLLVACIPLTVALGAGADSQYPEIVAPFLEKHCIDCHDADAARAGFRMDALGADFKSGNNAGLWKEVMDKINSGEMPPKKKARPDAQEAFAWRRRLRSNSKKRRSSRRARVDACRCGG